MERLPTAVACFRNRDQPRRARDQAQRGWFDFSVLAAVGLPDRTMRRASRPRLVPRARHDWNPRNEPLRREETALASTLKTALVTGAGSGIGRSIAAALANWGCASPWSDATARNSNGRAPRCPAGRDSAFVAPCDIGDRFAVKAVVDQVVCAFGAIDVLVCNAGTNVKNRSLESLEPADWDRMIATNLTGLVQPRPRRAAARCGCDRMDW